MVYQKIKKVYIILTYITNLVTFIVTQSYAKKTKRSFEYTSISKYVANFYIITLNIIFIFNTLFPNLFIAKFFSNHCYFLVSDWGKMIISYMISIMFWGTDSLPHFLYGVITLVSCLGLYLTEFIFNCGIITEETDVKISSKTSQKDLLQYNLPNEIKSKDILISKIQH